MRLGLSSQRLSAEPALVGADVTGLPQRFRSTDVGARLAVVVDQLDAANLGLTRAPRGETGVTLFLGRP